MRMYGASGIFEADTMIKAQSNETLFSRLTEQRRKVKQHIHSVFPQSLIVGSRSTANWRS